jgi:hypothetical protein
MKRLLQLLLSLNLLLAAGLLQASNTRLYDFKVYLDDSEIGSHRFEISSDTATQQVKSKADFDVKFLFFNAYQYRHSNTEIWQGECLQAINATTDDNGERLFVRGEKEDGALVLRTNDGSRTVEGCIRSFAYWDPDLLNSTHLLNSQTGELEPVEVMKLGTSTIDYRGQQVPAMHYIISGEDLSIELWYSTEEEWLALESTLENGKRLRYRLP